MLARPHRWVAPLAGVLLLGCLSTGCAAVPTSGSDQPGVQSPPSVAPGAAGAAQRTEISSASIPDLSAALDSNGVDDSRGWAKIMIENRPYPPGPAGDDKIRHVLARFHADPETAAEISTALSP